MGIEGPKKGSNPERPSGLSRRDVLLGATAAAAVGAGLWFRNSESKEVDGQYEASERFEWGQKGYRMLYGELERDEILFVDAGGYPLGGPVQIEEVEGVSPGALDENGLISSEGFNQNWLDAVRERVCQREEVPCNLVEDLPRQLNVTQAFREAFYQNPGKAAFRDHEPETFVDIVRYFGSQQVIGRDENRIDFVREHALDQANLPDEVKKHLGRIIPGIAAQESKFNNAALSGVGARGIFQFMPDTWQGLGYSEEDIKSLITQTEAVGRHFTQIYNTITNNGAAALKQIWEQFFADDEESFERDFLVPVLVNAYNTGQGRMVRALEYFARYYPTRAGLEKAIGAYPDGFGTDVFLALTRAASKEIEPGKTVIPEYGVESSEYTARCMALAKLLD